MQEFTKLPIQFCENLLVKSDCLNGFVSAPLATFELTLFKSVKRGCLLSRCCDGIFVSCGEHTMTRSIILKTDSLSDAISFQKAIEERSNFGKQRLIEEVSCNSTLTSKYCKLLSFYSEVVGTLIFLRFAFSTQDAAGHNMTTKSSDEILDFILAKYSSFNLSYISVSGNICADKKNSSINGLLSRGRRVSAEITVSRKMCLKVLKTTPEKIVELNYYKNYIGSSLAGSVRSANAHFANIIAAFYLATGQDVANVVEGSQGFVFADTAKDGSLRFSISCPNLILGSVGNGKNYPFIKENISKMLSGAAEDNLPKQMSIILGATILCGEISLLASLTNKNELVDSHVRYERAVGN